MPSHLPAYIKQCRMLSWLGTMASNIESAKQAQDTFQYTLQVTPEAELEIVQYVIWLWVT